MRAGGVLLGPLFFQVAHGDQGVLFRHLESEIVARMVAERVDVGIPAFARLHREIASAFFVHHLIAGIFDEQLVGAALRHGLRHHHVKAGVFFLVFLNERHVLAGAGDAPYAEIWQQCEFDHAVAIGHGVKLQLRGGGEVIVFRDGGVDLIVVRLHDAIILVGTGGMALQLALAVLRQS